MRMFPTGKEAEISWETGGEKYGLYEEHVGREAGEKEHVA